MGFIPSLRHFKPQLMFKFTFDILKFITELTIIRIAWKFCAEPHAAKLFSINGIS